MQGVQGRIIIAFDVSSPAGKNGPPPHIHFQENEEFRVKAGILGVRIGGKELIVPAGGSVTIPAGTVHSWWNAGEDMLEFNGQFSGQLTREADFDRFAQAVFAVANAGPPDKPPIFHIARVAWRHRHTQAGAMPPPVIQRILFPVILFIGWILGKYRGDRWPGSPASCPGAPEVNVANADPLR